MTFEFPANTFFESLATERIVRLVAMLRNIQSPQIVLQETIPDPSTEPNRQARTRTPRKVVS
jgi:hypothetical protein